MREIEVKARVKNPQAVKSYLDRVSSSAKRVYKRDHYFRREYEEKPSFRIRQEESSLTFTNKIEKESRDGEDNLEYEFSAPFDQYDKAVEFFYSLGYRDYFVKIKDGYEWTYKGVHVELLEVNDLGFFLECEVLLPFGSDDGEQKRAFSLIYEIFDECRIKKDDIERRSYRSMILSDEAGIEVYTDGGAKENPGPGGWAYCIFSSGRLLAKGSGGEELTTNNRMELSAVIGALTYLIDNKYSSCTLFLDSQYVKNGITSWIATWKKNGWKTLTGDVKNKDLWVALDELNGKIKVDYQWVRGHSGVQGNEICDALVKEEFSKFLK